MPRQTVVVRGDQADAERAERGAGEVADPAQDGRREGEQPELEPEIESRLGVVRDVEHAGRAGQGAGHGEGDGDRAVDVDAHHPRRLGVLGDRAHRLALARVAHPPHQRQQHRDGDRHDQQRLQPVRHAAQIEQRLGRHDVAHAGVVEPVELGRRHARQDEGHADRRDQRRQSGRVSQASVGDELDARVQRPAEHHRHEQRQQQAAGGDQSGLGTVQAEVRAGHRDGDHRPPHEHVAVGEVDQLDDAVDQRVAEGHQGVDRALRDADERDAEELVRGLDEVDQQPDGQDAQQQDREDAVELPRDTGERREDRLLLCARVCCHRDAPLFSVFSSELAGDLLHQLRYPGSRRSRW